MPSNKVSNYHFIKNLHIIKKSTHLFASTFLQAKKTNHQHYRFSGFKCTSFPLTDSVTLFHSAKNLISQSTATAAAVKADSFLAIS